MDNIIVDNLNAKYAFLPIKPIVIPKAYVDGWNAGKNDEPYNDTKSITWKCGYDDGKYNLPSSLL